MILNIKSLIRILCFFLSIITNDIQYHLLLSIKKTSDIDFEKQELTKQKSFYYIE